MKLLGPINILLLSAASLLAAPLLFAQPKFDPGKDPRREYVQFPIGKNAEDLVKERLHMDQQLGPFKELVRQILADPDKFGFDPAKFKDVKMDDQKLKDAVKDWIAHDKELQQAVKQWVKKVPADKRPDMEKLQKDVKQILDQPPPKTNLPDVKMPVGPKPIEVKDVDGVKAAEKLMIKAEESKLGDWLKNSDAWKRAFEDLRGNLNNSDAARLRADDWSKKLGLTPGKTIQITEDTLKRLRDMPKPNLEGLQWNQALPGVGKIPTPNLGAPSMPTFRSPSLPSLGTAALWILLVVVFLLGVWQLRRWSRRSVPKPDHRVTLGPWPVRPETVSTRTDLVKAFDYLALWSLGLEVKSWNHLAVVRRWCETSPAHAEMARTLASLYEAARYTHGAEELPPQEREQARRSLVELAEVL